MNISELIAFLAGVKEEFGDIKVKLHITDRTDPYALREKLVDVDDVTASKSLSLRNTNSNGIEQYVQIHGEIE